MSSLKISGNAVFRHKKSGELLEISAAELIISVHGVDDRGMGEETLWTIEGEFDDFEYLNWTVSEYPAGILDLPAKLDFFGDYVVVEDNIEIMLDQVDSDDVLRMQFDEAAVEQMVEWFFEHYEDPAENVSYETKEGGYQWAGRGPHRATDVLSVQFPEHNETLIEEAVSEIEREDGTTDWAIQLRFMEMQDADDEPEEYFEPTGRSDSPNLRPNLDIPAQELGGLVFAINAAGQIDLARPADIPAITGTELVSTNVEHDLWDDIQVLSQQLSTVLMGSNAFPRLADKVAHYNSVAYAENRSIGAIYVKGTLLRNQTYRDMERLEAGEAPDGVRENLEDLLDLHTSLIGTSVDGKKLLEGASTYAKSEDEILSYKKSRLGFVEETLASGDLITPEAVSALRDVIELSGSNPDPGVTTQIAQKSESNLIKAIAWVTKGAVAVGGTVILGSVIQQSVVGAEAIQACVLAVDFATAWLALNLPALQGLIAPSCADGNWPQAFQNFLSWYDDTH